MTYWVTNGFPLCSLLDKNDVTNCVQPLCPIDGTSRKTLVDVPTSPLKTQVYYPLSSLQDKSNLTKRVNDLYGTSTKTSVDVLPSP